MGQNDDGVLATRHSIHAGLSCKKNCQDNKNETEQAAHNEERSFANMSIYMSCGCRNTTLWCRDLHTHQHRSHNEFMRIPTHSINSAMLHNIYPNTSSIPSLNPLRADHRIQASIVSLLFETHFLVF